MTRTVALADDVYEDLESLKGAAQSFSELLREMARAERGRRRNALFGSIKMTDKEYGEFMAGILERRRQSRPRREVLEGFRH